jgi:hypothetical protein
MRIKDWLLQNIDKQRLKFAKFQKSGKFITEAIQ